MNSGDYKTFQAGGICVSYEDELDGGGSDLCQGYAQFIEERVGQVGRAFEWCSGPGFIGFSLLARQLCGSLCLADVNPRAIEACARTVASNHLEDRVRIYQADCLHGIPADERWDLVVGNPPHFGSPARTPRPDRVYLDEGWELHGRFYAQVGTFLAEGAVIVLIENAQRSSPETFRSMIEAAGLMVSDAVPNRYDDRYYFLTVKRRGSIQ